MIYCKVSELDKYRNYSDNMRVAIDFVQKTDLSKLPMGKTSISGDEIYVNKMKINTKELSELKYEVHHKYIDIQIDLGGNEKLFIKNDNNNCIEDYNENGDYALFASSEPDAVCSMNPEYCTICFPYEIHMPGVCNTSDSVEKCVIKVLDK